MALPGKNRIYPKGAYQKVFKEGKTVRNSFFFVKYLVNEQGCARWGIAISAKTFKRSIDRNHIKRMISEAILKIGKLDLSVDIIIVPAQTILNKSLNEIKKGLNQVINSIKVNP